MRLDASVCAKVWQEEAVASLDTGSVGQVDSLGDADDSMVECHWRVRCLALVLLR